MLWAGLVFCMLCTDDAGVVAQVRMQAEWGAVSELYESSASSLFIAVPVPPWIRAPR